MKKLSVLLFVVLASATVASARDWGVGGRLGSGLEAVGQRYLWNGNYIEARLGMNWFYAGGLAMNLSAMHVWNVENMDWTWEGNWYFDAGVGAAVGGFRNYTFFGVQGMARLGYEFEDVPLRLAIDWSPAFGPEFVHGVYYMDGQGRAKTVSDFNVRGLGSFGVSCVYRF